MSLSSLLDKYKHIENCSCIRNLLQELWADKGQGILQKFEEGRLQQYPLKGLVNGGN